jgi:hypothetical protein
MISGRRPAAARTWLLAAALVLPTERIEVTPVVVESHVVASFSAPTSLTPDVQEIVKSGLLVTLTYSVELRRPSGVWFDRVLAAATLAAAVKFDNLTGVYQVSKLVNGHVVWSDQTRDEAEMRTWMTHFEKVSLSARETLEPNAEYYVQVRMHATPKRTFSIWPWSGEAASGRADFTFIR